MTYELGEVIATRKLYLVDDDRNTQPILIKLGRPVLFPGSSDWYVPFQITGTGSEAVLCAAGIDGFLALQQVMSVIGAQLTSLNEACGDRLRWEGDEKGDLGFPV